MAFIPGAECLPEEANGEEEEDQADDEDDSDEEGWVDVPESGKPSSIVGMLLISPLTVVALRKPTTVNH